MSAPRPIVIVTGANAGVGYGICERFLLQLSEKTPHDVLPQFKSLAASNPPETTPEVYDGLTIILACRSKERALEARTTLLNSLDQHIAKLKKRADYDGHAERFRENVELNYHRVDMADVQSVFDFAEELSNTYPYVSHLICNAGAAFFSLIDIPGAIRSFLFRGIIPSITVVPYKVQPTGLMSKDGLGAVWHCNLFGHYVMYRRLQSLFKSYAEKFSRPARVLWTSSLEAQPCWYNRDDWQLVKTDHAYEGSKYEIDLVSSELQRRSQELGGEAAIVRHITVHPGIVWSDMSKNMIWSVFNVFIGLAFYIGRWMGSPNHAIKPVPGGISATYCALASLALIPTGLLAFSHVQTSKKQPSSLWEDSLYNLSLYEGGLESAEKTKEAEQQGKFIPVKFGSQADRLGREYVGAMPVVGWETHKEEAAFLLEKCETLYTSFATLNKSSSQVNGDTA
ncbi:hypothetical protein BDY19DRAFT_924999 [Irpex rosettiformis]|uniref:Uncharacterized protein n=1 Tax=Irpex rosettiformis TaxID=378272 RepID=A0ACB8UEF9_9APHY|nr:hypothetical protein BDY19DRAFT_924999 [Irpex rosettiformis]